MKDWESIVLPLVALMAAFMLIALALLVARRLTLWLEKESSTTPANPAPGSTAAVAGGSTPSGINQLIAGQWVVCYNSEIENQADVMELADMLDLGSSS